ncbi:MAG TPA: ABC transporter permease [Phototrophicaceae bacterium]|nr:ABC transporter permease [Phototrophicaceae bacterium]
MKPTIFVLGVLGTLFLLASWLAPFDPMQTNPAQQMQPPSREHFLGTDTLGRDVFSRLWAGGQRTLGITAAATLISVIPGLILGLIAGIFHDVLDKIIGILINALLAFPTLLLALVILTLLGPGPLALALATGFSQIGSYARMLRSAVIGVRSAQYVEAAVAAGATRWNIVREHILPNIRPTMLTYASITFGYNLLNSAALSFLGLGGEPGVPDWGVMLAEGRAVLRTAPWLSLVPGVAITMTVMAVNQLARQGAEPSNRR